ncbi:MAG: hypothetical protein LBE04_07335 [Prevotellaceae bacterium]|jgi:hypothetical protein|nr:hypothetical protein [Prevotellaceae bacterium]
MIRHYFKIALRNLWKYKSQTLISVAGRAIGLACFAIATQWIRTKCRSTVSTKTPTFGETSDFFHQLFQDMSA